MNASWHFCMDVCFLKKIIVKSSNFLYSVITCHLYYIYSYFLHVIKFKNLKILQRLFFSKINKRLWKKKKYEEISQKNVCHKKISVALWSMQPLNTKGISNELCVCQNMCYYFILTWMNFIDKSRSTRCLTDSWKRNALFTKIKIIDTGDSRTYLFFRFSFGNNYEKSKLVCAIQSNQNDEFVFGDFGFNIGAIKLLQCYQSLGYYAGWNDSATGLIMFLFVITDIWW